LGFDVVHRVFSLSFLNFRPEQLNWRALWRGACVLPAREQKMTAFLLHS
jgi:hypothetical protein